MSFLHKIRDAFIRFMYGRNGLDQLNQMLFRVLLVIYILAIFIQEGAAGAILSVLIENLFLMPVLSAAFALLPFFYIAIRFPITKSAQKRNWKPHSQSSRPHISEVTILYPQ